MMIVVQGMEIDQLTNDTCTTVVKSSAESGNISYISMIHES